MQLEVAIRPLKCGGTLRELDTIKYGLNLECEAHNLVGRLVLGKRISANGRVVCIHVQVQRAQLGCVVLYCVAQ